MIRSAVLARTPGIGGYVGSDRNLLAELGLHGRILQLPETLFLRRLHAGTSMQRFPREDERLAWFGSKAEPRSGRFTWTRLAEYARSVGRVRLTPTEKLHCYAALGRWVGSRHHDGELVAAHLVRELRAGGERERSRS